MCYYIHFNQDAESIKRAQKAMTDLQEQLEDMQRILDYLNKENDSKTKEIQVTNLYGLSQQSVCTAGHSWCKLTSSISGVHRHQVSMSTAALHTIMYSNICLPHIMITTLATV